MMKRNTSGLSRSSAAARRPLPEGTTQTATLVEAFGTPPFGTGISAADAFLLAANKERLAMEFYANWAKLYPEGEQRQLLLHLSEVERGHKARVEAMFTNAAFPEVVVKTMAGWPSDAARCCVAACGTPF